MKKVLQRWLQLAELAAPQSDHQPGWLLSEGSQPQLYPRCRRQHFSPTKSLSVRQAQAVRSGHPHPGQRTPGAAPPSLRHPDLTRTRSGSFHSSPFSLRRDFSRPLHFLPWNPRGRGVPGLSARAPSWAPGHCSGPPPTAHRDPAQPRWKSSLSGLHPAFTDNYVMPVHTRFHSTSAPTRAPSTLTQAVPRRENASRPEGTPGGRAGDTT